MKRRPVIERREPGAEELAKRQAHRRRVRELVRSVSERVEPGVSRDDLGRAMIEAGAVLVASAQDGAGAASFLGATSGRISPLQPHSPARRSAEAHFARSGR